MTITLDFELEKLNFLVGADFPEADEDSLWRCAEVWAAAALELRQLTPGAVQAGARVVGALHGEAGVAFAGQWQRYAAEDGLLEQVAAACDELALACDRAAVEVEYAKIQYIAALVVLGVTLASLTAALIAGGVSALGMPVAIAAAQFTIRLVLTRLLTAIAFGTAFNVAIDVVAQSIQSCRGHLDEWDWAKTLRAAADGAIFGAVGGGVMLAGAAWAPGLLATGPGMVSAAGITGAVGGVAAPLAHGEAPTGRDFLFAVVSGVAGGVGPDLVRGGPSTSDLSRISRLDSSGLAVGELAAWHPPTDSVDPLPGSGAGRTADAGAVTSSDDARRLADPAATRDQGLLAGQVEQAQGPSGRLGSGHSGLASLAPGDTPGIRADPGAVPAPADRSHVGPSSSQLSALMPVAAVPSTLPGTSSGAAGATAPTTSSGTSPAPSAGMGAPSSGGTGAHSLGGTGLPSAGGVTIAVSGSTSAVTGGAAVSAPSAVPAPSAETLPLGGALVGASPLAPPQASSSAVAPSSMPPTASGLVEAPNGASNGEPTSSPTVRRLTDTEAIALVRDSAFPTDAGLAFYAVDDEMREFASVVRPVEGLVTLDLHGSPRGFQIDDFVMSAEQFAGALRALQAAGILELADGTGIKLLSCDTAVGGLESPAARLARELGVAVVAPDQPVWTAMDGDEKVASPILVGGVLLPKDPPDGQWHRFGPAGAEPLLGDSDQAGTDTPDAPRSGDWSPLSPRGPDGVDWSSSFDPRVLVGADPHAIMTSIPDTWIRSSSRSGGGMIFADPDNPGRQIRIMPGYTDENRPDRLTHGPYAEISQNGVRTKVALLGNPTLRGE